MFEDTTSDSEIARKLHQLRRRALAKELFSQIGAVCVALFLLEPIGAMPNGMPVALIILCLVSLWATMLDEFVIAVYKHFFSRIPFTHSALDLAALPEPKESKEEFFERLMHFCQHRIGLTFVIIGVLFELVHLLLRLFKPE
jgi:hypothetical protein